MKKQHLSHILLLNLAMICISTSGALGRFITLPPPITIWYRAVFSILFLGIFCFYKKFNFRFDLKKHGFTIFLSGILMAAHWVTYFYALQWSNVAVAMLTLFTYPIMTTLLEPVFLKTKYQPSHIYLSLIIVVGIFFLVPSYNLENNMTKGLLMGLLSAFVYAVRNLLLKTKIGHFNSSVLMLYLMVVMAVVLFPVLFLFETDFQMLESQLPYIIFLGLITTAVGHTLFLNSFKHFSVSTVSIMSSMQPIFGILIAVIFLHEYPNWRSLIGGTLILMTVIIESKRSSK